MSADGNGLMHRTRRGAAWALVGVLLAAPAQPEPSFKAAGRVADQRIEVSVDSEAARQYLENHLQHGSARSGDEALDTALAAAAAEPLSNAVLQTLTERFSPDLATLYLLDRLYRDERNGGFQRAFHEQLARIRAQGGPLPLPGEYRRYLLVFVPGYAYAEQRGTGADFARQRRLFEEAGLDTVLIETDGLGDVEPNGDVVARELQRLARQDRPIVLISVSKGSAEAALALGRGPATEAACAVAAWVSIGGILRGSPYADWASQWPRNWAAGIAFAWQGLKPRVIRNLTTEKRRPAFERLAFAPHTLLLQYIGAPLSGHIGKNVRGRYNVIKRLGPNDGLTLLLDEVIAGGAVVTDIGLDHYYRDPEIDLRTLALAIVVMEELRRRESESAQAHRCRH